MRMNATKVVKAALVIAILVALFKLVSKGRGGARRRWSVPQPYALERYDNYDAPSADDEDYEDEEFGGDENDLNEDYENEEYDDDYQNDDYEQEDGQYEDMGGEDVDYETSNNPVEHFTGAAQPYTGTPKGLMNVATDLLPKPTYVDQNFAEFAPKALLGQNFLETKKYIGVDTKGSSLRNPSYDLRSSPTIPRQNVGPWAQSTIDADLFRKPLE